MSKPLTPGWLPVGRLHSLGMQAERRMQVLLGCHQVCDTFTWVLPKPFGACDIPGAGRSSFAPVGSDLHQLGEPWFQE